MIVYLDGKTLLTEIIINHNKTKKVKDGEDWHGSQTTNL